MAVDAERPQPVGRRRQDERTDRLDRLVAHRRRGNRLQSVLVQPRLRAEAAGQNNGKSLFLQNANADSSRTGQPLNSQWFLGFSNPTYGTLTGGRVNTLSLDAINSYDPMGGSYAFSPVGYSGSYAGFGDTEAARANTAVKYRVDIQNFRLGGLVQVGGYNWGNGTDGIYQGQVGGDFKFPSGGVLSIDGTASFAKDAVNLGTFGTLTQCSTLTKGAFAGQTECTYGIPGIHSGLVQPVRLPGDAVEQRGIHAQHQVQVAGLDLLCLLPVHPAAEPEQRLPERVRDDRLFQRSRNAAGFNVPGTFANKACPTQWAVNNAYNIPEGRERLLGRRQVRDQFPARCDRRVLLAGPKRL